MPPFPDAAHALFATPGPHQRSLHRRRANRFALLLFALTVAAGLLVKYLG